MCSIDRFGYRCCHLGSPVQVKPPFVKRAMCAEISVRNSFGRAGQRVVFAIGATIPHLIVMAPAGAAVGYLIDPDP